MTESRPLVRHPNSVTHWSCPEATDPQHDSHHIVNGQCVYCKKGVQVLAAEQEQMLEERGERA